MSKVVKEIQDFDADIHYTITKEIACNKYNFPENGYIVETPAGTIIYRITKEKISNIDTNIKGIDDTKLKVYTDGKSEYNKVQTEKNKYDYLTKNIEGYVISGEYPEISGAQFLNETQLQSSYGLLIKKNGDIDFYGNGKKISKTVQSNLLTIGVHAIGKALAEKENQNLTDEKYSYQGYKYIVDDDQNFTGNIYIAKKRESTNESIIDSVKIHDRDIEGVNFIRNVKTTEFFEYEDDDLISPIKKHTLIQEYTSDFDIAGVLVIITGDNPSFQVVSNGNGESGLTLTSRKVVEYEYIDSKDYPYGKILKRKTERMYKSMIEININGYSCYYDAINATGKISSIDSILAEIGEIQLNATNTKGEEQSKIIENLKIRAVNASNYFILKGRHLVSLINIFKANVIGYLIKLNDKYEYSGDEVSLELSINLKEVEYMVRTHTYTPIDRNKAILEVSSSKLCCCNKTDYDNYSAVIDSSIISFKYKPSKKVECFIPGNKIRNIHVPGVLKYEDDICTVANNQFKILNAKKETVTALDDQPTEDFIYISRAVADYERNVYSLTGIIDLPDANESDIKII